MDEQREVYRAIDLALRVGEVVMSSGAGASDVAATMLAVTSACDLRGCTIAVNFTTLSVSYQSAPDAPPETHMRVVQYRGYDYALLTEVDHLVRDLAVGQVDRTEASRRLNEVTSVARPYPRWAVIVSSGLLAAGAAMMLGGGPLVVAITFVTTICVDLVIRQLARRRIPAFYQQVLGALIATGVALSLHAADAPVDPDLIVASGIIMLLSGIALVGAVQDALTNNYVTASARMFEVLLLTGGIIAGITIGLTIGQKLDVEFFVSSTVTTWSELPTTLLGGAIVAIAFAYGSYTPLRALIPIGITGLLGQLVYQASVQWDVGPALSSGAAALVVGVVSYSLAGRVRVPPLVVVVSGIVPLLPGLIIYDGLLQLLTQDNVYGLFTLLSAASIGVALASGVILGEYVAQPLKREARRLETRLAGPRLVGPLRPLANRKTRRAARRRRSSTHEPRPSRHDRTYSTGSQEVDRKRG
ncbi:MAG: threonine/serine ThrE exporter family protein [Nocardioidaceae bacterium]